MLLSRPSTPVFRVAAVQRTAPVQAPAGSSKSIVILPDTSWVTPVKSCSVLFASKPTRDSSGTIS